MRARRASTKRGSVRRGTPGDARSAFPSCSAGPRAAVLPATSRESRLPRGPQSRQPSGARAGRPALRPLSPAEGTRLRLLPPRGGAHLPRPRSALTALGAAILATRGEITWPREAARSGPSASRRGRHARVAWSESRPRARGRYVTGRPRTSALPPSSGWGLSGRQPSRRGSAARAGSAPFPPVRCRSAPRLAPAAGSRRPGAGAGAPGCVCLAAGGSGGNDRLLSFRLREARLWDGARRGGTGSGALQRCSASAGVTPPGILALFEIGSFLLRYEESYEWLFLNFLSFYCLLVFRVSVESEDWGLELQTRVFLVISNAQPNLACSIKIRKSKARCGTELSASAGGASPRLQKYPEPPCAGVVRLASLHSDKNRAEFLTSACKFHFFPTTFVLGFGFYLFIYL